MYWLARYLEEVCELWPCPNGWALAGLWGVFDQCIKTRVAALVACGLNSHVKDPLFVVRYGVNVAPLQVPRKRKSKVFASIFKMRN